MSNPRDDRHYDLGRSHRNSPRVDSYGGAYGTGQGGQPIVLPPPLSAFRLLPSPAPSAYTQQPSPGRNDLMTPSYGQYGWANNTHTMAAPPQPPSFTSHQVFEPRYPTPQSHSTYHSRGSPSLYIDTHTTRKPTTVPHSAVRDERYMGSAYPTGYAVPSTVHSSEIRSPVASYAMSSYPPYPHHQPSPFPQAPAPEPRYLHHPVSYGHSQQHHVPPHHMGIPMPAEWDMPPRADSHVYNQRPRHLSDASYVAQPETPTDDTPAVKPKPKRRRADAEQLKVLNEVFERTAFPTTEERASLAKQLNMTPRSVQIWFQNKRQSLRQERNRQSSNALPHVVHPPYASSTHQTSSINAEASLSPRSRYGGGEVLLTTGSTTTSSYHSPYPGDVPLRAGSHTVQSPTTSSRRGRIREDEVDSRRRHGGFF